MTMKLERIVYKGTFVYFKLKPKLMRFNDGGELENGSLFISGVPMVFGLMLL